eukprot:1763363-Amphidinium_carterae.1
MAVFKSMDCSRKLSFKDIPRHKQNHCTKLTDEQLPVSETLALAPLGCAEVSLMVKPSRGDIGMKTP